MPGTDVPNAARTDLECWRATSGGNAFDHDPCLQRLLLRYLGDAAPELGQRLREVANKSGPELDSLVNECNRDENLPRLRRLDDLGRPTEEIVFHPAHHDVGRVFWGSGVLSVLEEPGNEVEAGAIAYILDQNGEAGHACPVACTAGAIKLIQRLGTDDQRERYLSELLDPDYDRRLHAAQFVTEVQGGSDVGSNSCRAVPEPGRPGFYRLSGEKWFCSVADAGLFVVSARVEAAADGTRGLGLFLVPRTVDDSVNGFRLERLKTKLGTRSMPTGEITFDGALAEAIGPTDQGFKNLVAIVLDASRVHNALAACGIMRRGFTEAHAYANNRQAFGRSIAEYGAVRSILARMKLRTAAGLATTFGILEISDRIDTGAAGEELVAARRIAVMANKYWTSLAATRNSRDGIEILGGNGTIEDFSVLPRLYRDAIVIESWEGTHNTLCAQIVRDFAARGLHVPWLGQLRAEIGGLTHSNLGSVAEKARSFLADVEARITRMLSGHEDATNAVMRPVVDRMCRLTDWVALAAQLEWEMQHEIEGDTSDALELYRVLYLDRADPQDTPEIVKLERRFSGSL